MNDATKATTELARVESHVALAPSPDAAFALGAMPAALALYLNDALYERVSSVALRLSKAEGITPGHLIGKPEACFAVVSRAITWRLDPFAVAMSTYQTPGGRIGFEGKLIGAVIANSGRLEPSAGGIRYEHYGDWSKIQGHFAMKTGSSGKEYAVPTWTDADARAGKPADRQKYPNAQSCGVRVIAQLRGEAKPRHLDFDLIQAQPRNSTLWATDPMTQICYTAVRRFGSAIVPELLMGVPFDAADMMPGAVDVTEVGSAEIAMPRARTEPMAVQEETGDEAPAASEPAAKPQDEIPAVASPEAAAPLKLDSAPAAMTRKASDAQRKMITDVAKRKGLTVAQLDEVLVERFSFGIDEIPMGLVGDAAKVLGALPNA